MMTTMMTTMMIDASICVLLSPIGATQPKQQTQMAQSMVRSNYITIKDDFLQNKPNNPKKNKKPKTKKTKNQKQKKPKNPKTKNNTHQPKPQIYDHHNFLEFRVCFFGVKYNSDDDCFKT